MATERWIREPAGRRSGSVRLDNLALVPASLLPYKARYQRLANQLPPGAILIVLPDEEGPEQEALKSAADRFLAKGHPVTTVSVDDIVARPSRSAGRPPPAPPEPAAQQTSATAVAPASGSGPRLVSGRKAAAVPPFTHELRLVSLDESRRSARFCVFQWHPTLFDDHALVEISGRIGHAGRARVRFQAAAPQLDATLKELVHHRLTSGYQIADWQ